MWLKAIPSSLPIIPFNGFPMLFTDPIQSLFLSNPLYDEVNSKADHGFYLPS
jgi:hypothetical protein